MSIQTTVELAVIGLGVASVVATSWFARRSAMAVDAARAEASKPETAGEAVKFETSDTSNTVRVYFTPKESVGVKRSFKDYHRRAKAGLRGKPAKAK